jgi:Uncharacterized conserved protein
MKKGTMIMLKDQKKCKIKIVKNGPYLVSGNVPLSEKIIVPNGKKYELKEGRKLPQAETYALCRCGNSKNPPFCDGSHAKIGFVGTETASRARYEDRAEWMEGPGIDLMDDNRCAYARFCHRDKGSVWELTERSYNEENIREAIRAASDCPTGRLTAVEKTGERTEPEYDPSIAIVQDSELGVSAGIFVTGNIPLESADGTEYELRNRYALCRCGESSRIPFCDASHVQIKYSDRNIVK